MSVVAFSCLLLSVFVQLYVVALVCGVLSENCCLIVRGRRENKFYRANERMFDVLRVVRIIRRRIESNLA